MGWQIAWIDNTVELTEECVEELETMAEDLGIYNPTQDGRLYFNPDNMEHMDFLWRDEIRELFLKHQVYGTVKFGSLDGDNFGQFWGYKFKDGVCTRLVGKLNWSKEK